MTVLAIASGALDRVVRAGAEPIAPECKDASMREKFEVLRDTMVALGMQVVFRVTILLRRWSY
jgi:hypothetical protein